MSERFYFRQFLSGHDFAVGDEFASAMRNFSYVLGDRESGEALLVDPAHRPEELLERLDADGLHLSGVVATHYHPDHVGGTLPGERHVEGIVELLELVRVPVHVQHDEAPWIRASSNVDADALVLHHDRDRLEVGELVVTLLLTPGHTPGSQCLLVDGRLLSGDTLFIDGCGRTDLPGGDARELYRSLSERLGEVGDEVVLHPGHHYSPEWSMALGEVRRRNDVFAPTDEDAWLAAFSA